MHIYIIHTYLSHYFVLQTWQHLCILLQYYQALCGETVMRVCLLVDVSKCN